MTNQERKADEFLIVAKENVKGAMTQLHPSPKDPLAVAFLTALDQIDATRTLLANRGI